MNCHLQGIAKTCICVCALLLCSCAAGQVRPLTVHVAVETDAGVPIAEAPIQLLTMDDVRFGFTEQSGQFTITLQADASESVIIARLWDGRWHTLSGTDVVRAQNRYEVLRRAYAFRAYYKRPISAQADEYHMQIVAYPAVTATGRLVDPAGSPLVGSIGSREYRAFARVREGDGGHFQIGGLRRATSDRLFVQLNQSGQVHDVPITAADTDDDFELGDVVIGEAVCDTGVSVTLQNHVLLQDTLGSPLSAAAAFIRTDGQLLFNFPADEGGDVWRQRFKHPPDRPLLPAGEYYVAPGLVTARAGMAVYLSVLDGRNAQLDAAGVPKITVVSGQPVSLQFDARASYEAIVQVGGDLVE